MSTPRILRIGAHDVVVLDALADLAPEHRGEIVVSGDHGGIGPARRAIQHPPRLAFFNDAGVGKDAAGTAGLELLAQFGIAAATVSSSSARIGDAEDTLEHGVVSHVNAPAADLWIESGRLVKDVVASLRPPQPS